jgi:hypothetical protein
LRKVGDSFKLVVHFSPQPYVHLVQQQSGVSQPHLKGEKTNIGYPKAGQYFLAINIMKRSQMGYQLITSNSKDKAVASSSADTALSRLTFRCLSGRYDLLDCFLILRFHTGYYLQTL